VSSEIGSGVLFIWMKAMEYSKIRMLMWLSN